MAKFHNFSQVIRNIDIAKQAILKDIGDALAEGLMEEFERLVIETAQYTGTTAASWKISMGGAGREGDSVEEQPFRTRDQALRAGHGVAVGIAMAANTGALKDISTKYRYAAIVIENNAPGADRAESGPLRKENTGAVGAFLRFQGRIVNKAFPVIRSRKI